MERHGSVQLTVAASNAHAAIVVQYDIRDQLTFTECVIMGNRCHTSCVSSLKAFLLH